MWYQIRQDRQDGAGFQRPEAPKLSSKKRPRGRFLLYSISASSKISRRVFSHPRQGSVMDWP